MHLITRQGKYIGFQKDWEKWQKLAKPSTLSSKLAEQSTSEKLAIPSTELAIPSTELAESSPKVSSCAVTQKIKNTITQETTQKTNCFLDNISLTEEEYQKLVERFGEAETKDRLEALSLYMKSTGKSYKDHYATVLNWERREEKMRRGQGGAYRGSPWQIRPRDSYTRPEDQRDGAQ